MHLLSKAILAIFREPKIYILSIVLMFLYCVVEFNFILPLLLGASKIGVGSIFDTVVYFFRLFLTGLTFLEGNTKLLLQVSILFIILTAIVSLFSSGYFHVVNSFLEGKSGKFWQGCRIHFFRILVICFKIFILAIMFFVFCSIVTIPSIILSKLSNVKGEMTILSGILTFLTVIVLGFQILVFRLYSIFWIITAFHFKKRIFKIAKIIADSYFWDIFLRIFILDLIFLVIQATFININNMYLSKGDSSWLSSSLLFILNWLFKSTFFSILISYLFIIFKHYKSKLE